MNISDGNRCTIRQQRNVDGIIAVGTADTGTGNKEAEHIIPVVTADRVVFRGKDITEFNNIPYWDKVKFERNGVLQIGTARPPQRRCKIPEIIIAVGVELILMIGFGIGSYHFRHLAGGKDNPRFQRKIPAFHAGKVANLLRTVSLDQRHIFRLQAALDKFLLHQLLWGFTGCHRNGGLACRHGRNPEGKQRKDRSHKHYPVYHAVNVEHSTMFFHRLQLPFIKVGREHRFVLPPLHGLPSSRTYKQKRVQPPTKPQTPHMAQPVLRTATVI